MVKGVIDSLDLPTKSKIRDIIKNSFRPNYTQLAERINRKLEKELMGLKITENVLETWIEKGSVELDGLLKDELKSEGLARVRRLINQMDFIEKQRNTLINKVSELVDSVKGLPEESKINTYLDRIQSIILMFEKMDLSIQRNTKLMGDLAGMLGTAPSSVEYHDERSVVVNQYQDEVVNLNKFILLHKDKYQGLEDDYRKFIGEGDVIALEDKKTLEENTP